MTPARRSRTRATRGGGSRPRRRRSRRPRPPGRRLRPRRPGRPRPRRLERYRHPSPAAQADLDAAGAAGQAAAEREAHARRQLEQAQEDFERAQRRGQRAEERARDAASQAAAWFGGPAGPGYAPAGPWAGPWYGGGGGGVNPFHTFANGRNDGWQWWNEDQFAGNVWPFHPANDAFMRGKWGVDQATGFGSNMAEAAAFGAAGAAQRLAGTPLMRTTITQGAFAHSINGRIVSAGMWTSVTRTTVPRPPSQVAQLTSRATTMNRLGWAARGGGSVLAGISGGIEQWQTDVRPERSDHHSYPRGPRRRRGHVHGRRRDGGRHDRQRDPGRRHAGRGCGRRGRRPLGGRCRDASSPRRSSPPTPGR